MEHLTLDDTQKLLQAIQQLYSLHDLSSFPYLCLEIVDRLVPSEVPGFHQSHLSTREIEYITRSEFPGFAPEVAAVPGEYWHENPITQNMPDTLYGVYKISDFATPTELDRLEGVYHRFMQIMGWGDMMTFFLPPAPPERWQDNLNRDVAIGGMTLTRPDRSFTERDRLILNLLHPHLIQAFQTALKFQQHQVVPQMQESIDCLGIVFLDDSGSVTQFTSQATRWLDRYFPSSRIQPCEPAIGLISGSVNLAPYINTHNKQLPEQLQSWVRYQIKRLKANDDNIPAPCLPLRVKQSKCELTIHLSFDPIGDRYLLLLTEEHQQPLSDSLELIGLSPREAEVLALLIQGKSPKEIAKTLAISTATARKHLENIYRKLDVQSQTEAVTKALQMLGALSSLPIV